MFETNFAIYDPFYQGCGKIEQIYFKYFKFYFLIRLGHCTHK